MPDQDSAGWGQPMGEKLFGHGQKTPGGSLCQCSPWQLEVLGWGRVDVEAGWQCRGGVSRQLGAEG